MSVVISPAPLTKADKLDLAERYLTQCPSDALITNASARYWLCKEHRFNPYEFAEGVIEKIIQSERRRRKEISQ